MGALFRKWRRVLGVQPTPREAERLKARTSSFPFVSGDTFRLLAGVEVFEGGMVWRHRLSPRVAFTDVRVASSPGFATDFLRLQSDTLDWFPNFLIIHGGDQPPRDEALIELSRSADCSVYCVNVTDETERVRALPIGLENAVLNKNGRLDLYINDMSLSAHESRSKTVLSSFHIETNPGVRAPIAKKFAQSRHGFDGVRWKLGEYRQQLRDTLFVISPPGNGVDCHRTWEAMALGAVPVVLKSAIAPSISKDMPMLLVDNYDDFLGMSDDELTTVYQSLSKLHPYALMAGYWAKKFA